MSRLSAEQLALTAREIEQCLEDSSLDTEHEHQPDSLEPLKQAAQKARVIPVIESHDLNAFQLTLSMGIPTVIDDVKDFHPQLWSPAVLVRGHEQASVHIMQQTGVDADAQPTSGTLQQFFDMFTMSDEARGCVVKLKVRLAYVNSLNHSITGNTGLSSVSIIRKSIPRSLSSVPV